MTGFTKKILPILQKKSFLFLFILNLLLVLPSFYESLATLASSWQKDEYSHGPLIPFLAALIGWHRLAQRKPPARPDWLGVPVLLGGFALLAISQLSAFEPPSHYGLIVVLTGLSLAFWGRAATKTLAPAFVYLLFAVPLPRLIYVALSADMQLVSSTLGVGMLQMLNVSVYQEGNVIDLGGYKLQVVEACNGLRYLFPLMSFGFLLALMFDDRMWKRAFLFLSTIPLTIGMNALRIALVGITVDRWGIQMAEGVLHDFEGWVIFTLCLLVLFGEMAILKSVGGNKGRFRTEYLSLPKLAPVTLGRPEITWPTKAATATTLLMAILLLCYPLDNRKEITPPHPPLAAFPSRFDAWRGEVESLPSEILSNLKLSDYWMASYKRAEDPSPVTLYMAYYASQRIGTSIHSPANCIPGGGWRIEEHGVAKLSVNGQSLPVSRLLIRKGEEAMLVYYWFDGRGRIINEQYGAKWYLFVDSLTLNRTDGALVRLTTPLSSTETPENGDQRIRSFLEKAYPSIRATLPAR